MNVTMLIFLIYYW